LHGSPRHRSPWHGRQLSRHRRLSYWRKLLTGLLSRLMRPLMSRHWMLLAMHRLLCWHRRLLARHRRLLSWHWRLLSRHRGHLTWHRGHLTWHRSRRSQRHGWLLLTHRRPSGSRWTAHLRPLWSWMHLWAWRHGRVHLWSRGSRRRRLRCRGDTVLSRVLRHPRTGGHTGMPQRAVRGPWRSRWSSRRTLRFHKRGWSLRTGRHSVGPRRTHSRRS